MKSNQISCNIIIDLLPLYREEICSEESKILIEEHFQTCENCRQLYGQIPIPSIETVSKPTETETFRKVNQKLKRSKLTKIVSVICSILLFIFAGLNISWYFLKYRPYHAVCKMMQRSDIGKGTQFHVEDFEFSYTVKMPAYLGFSGGFINVSAVENNKIYLDENKTPMYEVTPYVSLFIWLQVNSETKYGVVITKGNTMYQIMIDKSLKFIPYSDSQPNEIEMYEKMITEHHDEIETLMNAANQMWGDKLP